MVMTGYSQPQEHLCKHPLVHGSYMQLVGRWEAAAFKVDQEGMDRRYIFRRQLLLRSSVCDHSLPDGMSVQSTNILLQIDFSLLGLLIVWLQDA